jgi:hypothetical protein
LEIKKRKQMKTAILALAAFATEGSFVAAVPLNHRTVATYSSRARELLRETMHQFSFSTLYFVRRRIHESKKNR